MVLRYSVVNLSKIVLNSANPTALPSHAAAMIDLPIASEMDGSLPGIDDRTPTTSASPSNPWFAVVVRPPHAECNTSSSTKSSSSRSKKRSDKALSEDVLGSDVLRLDDPKILEPEVASGLGDRNIEALKFENALSVVGWLGKLPIGDPGSTTSSSSMVPSYSDTNRNCTPTTHT